MREREVAGIRPQALELRLIVTVLHAVEAFRERGRGPREAHGDIRRLDNPGSGSADVWTSDERQLIHTWKTRFQERGWLVDLIVLPYSLVAPGVADGDMAEDSTCVDRVRAAAARERADAVLVIQSNSAAYGEITPWAILDFTIIGAMVFDAHRVSAVTVMEAFLIDTDNEYLYLSASGEASAKDSVPAFMISQAERRLLEKSRKRALQSLAERLSERVIALDG